MALAKSDIENVGFEHSLRGYDVQQVDDFLEKVANEVGEMNEKISSLEAQLADANSKLDGSANAIEDREISVMAELEPESLLDKEAQAELDVARERAEAEARRAREAEEKVVKLQEQLQEKTKLDNAISEAFIAAQRSAQQIKDDARVEADRIYQESEAKARDFIRESLANKAAIDNEASALRSSMQKFRDEYLEMLDRFTAQAREEFDNLPEPAIPEQEVASELPDPDSIPVIKLSYEAEQDEQVIRDNELPRLTTDKIPHIEIPTITGSEE